MTVRRDRQESGERRRERSPARGVDGLTTTELRRGREDWWDIAFTQALLGPLSETGPKLVEVGCGLGRVARETLPHLPHHAYIGVDIDASRIGEARADLLEGPLSGRTGFIVARAEALPLADARVDAVLFCMTLQHVVSPPAALEEARRILRGSGRLIAAEPDNLGQRWFFDGTLEKATRSFATLVDRCRETRRPADLAIGPRVPSLATAAGFRRVALKVHAVFATQRGPALAFAAHFNEISRLFAASSGLDDNHPDLAACRDSIAEWLGEGDPERVGQWGSTLPVYVTTAHA
jgi:ubiquinone/menaquinone biosynthesis C-methylase UbiE